MKVVNKFRHLAFAAESKERVFLQVLTFSGMRTSVSPILITLFVGELRELNERADTNYLKYGSNKIISSH